MDEKLRNSSLPIRFIYWATILMVWCVLAAIYSFPKEVFFGGSFLHALLTPIAFRQKEA